MEEAIIPGRACAALQDDGKDLCMILARLNLKQVHALRTEVCKGTDPVMRAPLLTGSPKWPLIAFFQVG